VPGLVTVLFADLVGFTLSDRLDAEDVSLVQDAYFDSARETTGRHGGLLEMFVGDTAMAVFGAPRVRDDDVERAHACVRVRGRRAHRAIPVVDAAADVAGASGLVEAGGWADYVRAEAHMSAGRWQEAIEAGLRAIGRNARGSAWCRDDADRGAVQPGGAPRRAQIEALGLELLEFRRLGS
jgi:hypothetical protein